MANLLLRRTFFSEAREVGGLVFAGSCDFVSRGVSAMALLRRHAPDAHELVQRHVSAVYESDEFFVTTHRSRLYLMADADMHEEVQWFAGALAHIAFQAEWPHTQPKRERQPDEEAMDRAADRFLDRVLMQLGGLDAVDEDSSDREAPSDEADPTRH
jgi:hypothetical protein